MTRVRSLRTRFVLSLVYVGFMVGCDTTSESPETPSATSDWTPIVAQIVDHLELVADEAVFGVGLPDLYPELPALFSEAVEAAGGTYLGTLSSAGPYGDGRADFQAAAAGLDRDGLRELMRDAPVGLMLPGATPADAPYAAMQDLLWEAAESPSLARHRTVHFHWGGAYAVEDRSFPIGSTAGAVPTDGEREAATYRDAILDVDYAALRGAHDDFEVAARSGPIRVTTPAGTDITFRIEHRPINRQDGAVSGERMETAEVLVDREIEFPAGAIRVAPIESSVQGTIVFPRSTWNGETVENLRLEFVDGLLSSATADVNLAAADAELSAPGANAFREFGLGFNPRLAVPDTEPWLPYFGYGSGVVRLSLGDNSEIGGDVGGGYVRWNFFLDATVTIGEDVWVEDGRAVR